MPELIQGDVTPQRIAREAEKILRDPATREEIEAEFKLVKEKLGNEGTSHRVAQIALHMMGTG